MDARKQYKEAYRVARMHSKGFQVSTEYPYFTEALLSLSAAKLVRRYRWVNVSAHREFMRIKVRRYFKYEAQGIKS